MGGVREAIMSTSSGNVPEEASNKFNPAIISWPVSLCQANHPPPAQTTHKSIITIAPPGTIKRPRGFGCSVVASNAVGLYFFLTGSRLILA